jgi:Arc/MetJ family transcription regulator
VAASSPSTASAILDIMMLHCYHQSVRTTLTIDDDVIAKINAEMRRSGKSFKETVNDALRTGLSVRKELKAAEPFRVRSKPLGTYPGLNYDSIAELLEQVEGPSHR